MNIDLGNIFRFLFLVPVGFKAGLFHLDDNQIALKPPELIRQSIINEVDIQSSANSLRFCDQLVDQDQSRVVILWIFLPTTENFSGVTYRQGKPM